MNSPSCSAATKMKTTSRKTSRRAEIIFVCHLGEPLGSRLQELDGSSFICKPLSRVVFVTNHCHKRSAARFPSRPSTAIAWPGLCLFPKSSRESKFSLPLAALGAGGKATERMKLAICRRSALVRLLPGNGDICGGVHFSLCAVATAGSSRAKAEQHPPAFVASPAK